MVTEHTNFVANHPHLQLFLSVASIILFYWWLSPSAAELISVWSVLAAVFGVLFLVGVKAFAPRWNEPVPLWAVPLIGFGIILAISIIESYNIQYSSYPTVPLYAFYVGATTVEMVTTLTTIRSRWSGQDG